MLQRTLQRFYISRYTYCKVGFYNNREEINGNQSDR